MATLPNNFKNYKSTEIFTQQNVPKMFLHLHNTRSGVYGKIKVITGSLCFTGFTSNRTNIEQEVILRAEEAVISPPEYWHKVALLTDDTQFYVEFYADKDSDIVIKALNERA